MRRELLKNNLIVTTLNVASLAVNFIAQIVIASYFGADDERDAFFAASAIPAYINAIITGSLVVVFLPRLVDLRINKNDNPSHLIGSMVTFMVIFLLLITFCLVVFSAPLVELLYQGFQPSKLKLTQTLLLALCPAVIFQALSSTIIAVYHSEHKFFRASTSLVFTPAITILLTFGLEDHLGIVSVALGTSAGWIATFLFLQIGLNSRYRLSFSNLFTDENFQLCLRTSLPLLVGGIVYRCNTVVERVIASNFPEGAVSYLGYAMSLITILSSITINGIATTVFPVLSQAWSERNDESFRRYFSGSLKITLMLCVPIIVFTSSFNEIIVGTIFQRGAFDSQDTQEVSSLLLILMGSFLFLCMNNIPAKIIYVTGISKFGFINAVLEVSIYIALSLILTRHYSYYGLAYAHFISVAISTIFACLIIHLKFNILAKSSLFQDSLKILLCGIPMLLIINSFYFWLEKPSFLIMVLLGATGFIVYYYLLSYFLEEATNIRKMINKKIQNIIYYK